MTWRLSVRAAPSTSLTRLSVFGLRGFVNQAIDAALGDHFGH